MQTLSQDQDRGSRHWSSTGSNPGPLHLSLTPSSSTTGFPVSSIFGSTTPRTPRASQRPGTSSGSAAADGLLTPGPFGNDVSLGDPSEADDSRSSSCRAFTLSPGSGGQASSLLPKKLPGRKPSLGDLPSYCTWQQQHGQAHPPPPVSRFRSLRRRANSASNLRAQVGAALGIGGPPQPITDTRNPPALPPEYALPSAAKLSSRSSIWDHNNTSPSLRSRANSNSMESARMVSSRQGTMPSSGSLSAGGGGMMPPLSAMGMQTESAMVHQHIQDMANKRISTLEYLRKAHEGRVYWFNTLLFDKPDLARMTYFDSRRLARRATNYLLLGLSLPTVIDLNVTSPLEFLRSLNLLLTEFDAFQSLHPETGTAASSLGRARIPNLNVFRRATPSAKTRRSSSANNDTLYEDGTPLPNANGSSTAVGGGGGGSSSSNISSSAGGSTSIMNGLGGSASVVSFGQSEADLLPGEEYVHLLTPSLPFDPDFFETFATLCDVLIDAYARLLSMLPTPRECNAAVAESFTKADARVRKIIVQGIVKEFEDTSRNGVRTEVANVGKIVLGGLM